MPDSDRTLNTNPDPSLASALRALPDAAPQPDLWLDLARTLAQRRRPAAWRRHARWLVPAALAAGLALAVLLPRGALNPGESAVQPRVTSAANSGTSPVAPTVAANELDNLHQRSQTLERWIAAVAARAPQDSRDLMAAVEVEDLIGLVDVQLGAAHDHNDALSLWRQRVALLEDLATIRGSAFAIAANDNDTSRAANASLNSIN